jgi:hypothetical protein
MSRPVDVDTRAPARAESPSEARPAVQSMRLMAGVRVPDSPLIVEALEYAHKIYERARRQDLRCRIRHCPLLATRFLGTVN